MSETISTNNGYSTHDLILQVMSPAAMQDNPLEFKLNGSKNFKLWHNRLIRFVMRFSQEWTQYTVKGNIDGYVTEHKLTTYQSETTLRYVENALLDVLKNSTEGEVRRAIVNMADTGSNSSKDILDYIVQTYDVSNVRDDWHDVSLLQFCVNSYHFLNSEILNSVSGIF